MHGRADKRPPIVSPALAPETSAADVAPESAMLPKGRPVVRGKFLFVGHRKLWVKGLEYVLPSRPAARPTLHVEQDLAAIAETGVNVLTVGGVPPVWFLDCAARHGLRVMPVLTLSRDFAGRPGRKGSSATHCEERDAIGRCAGHPAILGYAVGAAISRSELRWYGRRRIEASLRTLCRVVKSADPGCLVTCINRRETEELQLPFLDFVCYDVASEDLPTLRNDVERLHNLVGDKPLILFGFGSPCRDSPLVRPLAELAASVRCGFRVGCAGTIVSAAAAESVGRAAEAPDRAAHGIRGLYAETPFAGDTRWPRISVVVCSFNGAATIRDTLEGLRALRYPDFEVIVVNDGSTDATRTIASDYGFRLINTENRGLSNARNTGWQVADGDIVAYTDDDAYPDPHWLHFVALSFIDSLHVGIGGPNIAPPGDGPIADCVANSPGGPVHVLLSDTEAEHIPGCNMAFRREALAEVGGFDPRFRAAGDDVDLCWRLQERGWTIGFNPAAVVWHHRRNSLRMYWKQQQGYGKAEALLVDKWPAKYNVLGHHAWSGRLYGKGLTQALRRRASSDARYRKSPAAIHSMHVGEAGVLASLPLMPEWYLLVGALAVLVLLGMNWPPLLWFGPLLVIAAAAPVAQAVCSAARAEFPTQHAAGIRRGALRALTGCLHLVQPLARLKGRLDNGLTPWRSSVEVTPVWQLADRRLLLHDSRLALGVWRSRIARLAGERRFIVRTGDDSMAWDVEILCGVLGGARMLLAVEDRPSGGQALRAYSWIRMSGAAIAIMSVSAIAAAAAAQHGAWLSAGVIGAGTGAVALLAWVQSGSALAAMRAVLTTLDAQQRSHPATAGSTGDLRVM